MGDLQVKKQTKKYDAVIVGSGAGGGMAAYVLANAGLKVCLIEAGPMFDPKTDSNQLKNPWESPRRGASTKFGLLVILMDVTGDGRSTVSLTPKPKAGNHQLGMVAGANAGRPHQSLGQDFPAFRPQGFQTKKY